MLREAFEYLIAQGRNTKPDIVTVEAEPSFLYYVRDSKGELQQRIACEPTRQHVAASLEHIATRCNGIRKSGDSFAVWYDRTGIEIRQFDQHCDSTRYALCMSPQLQVLVSLEKSKIQYSQSQILKLLRVDLHGCLGQCRTLPDILRRVRFGVSQSGDSEIGHGKSSVGKSLMAEVTGTATLPEKVLISVPIFDRYELHAIRGNILCALEPEPTSQTFQLIPLAGEIEQAIAKGEVRLGSLLRQMPELKDACIYHGKY